LVNWIWAEIGGRTLEDYKLAKSFNLKEAMITKGPRFVRPICELPKSPKLAFPKKGLKEGNWGSKPPLGGPKLVKTLVKFLGKTKA